MSKAKTYNTHYLNIGFDDSVEGKIKIAIASYHMFVDGYKKDMANDYMEKYVTALQRHLKLPEGVSSEAGEDTPANSYRHKYPDCRVWALKIASSDPAHPMDTALTDEVRKAFEAAHKDTLAEIGTPEKIEKGRRMF